MGNCHGLCTGSRMDSGDILQGLSLDETLTLVVGNDTPWKPRVARSLAEARGAENDDVSKAGVRVFTREASSTTPVIIDTIPLSTSTDWGRVVTARMWISQNSLRKLSGKLVFVVCVIGATDPQDEIFQEPDFEANRFSWLHLLACIFEKHIQKIMVLVNSDATTDEASTRHPLLRDMLRRNGFTGTITFFNFGRGELTSTIKSVLQHSIYIDEAYDHRKMGDSARRAGPFILRGVARNASDAERFGPWGPENIIVFGRSGSGKSTLAQMLTMGRLDHAPGHELSASSSIRGVTTSVKYAEGRGWRIIDTPGLGESINDEKSSVPTQKAGNLIKEYVQLVEGTYCHFLYVWKKGKLDDLDERLWGIFKKTFTSEMSHVTIVVSDADDDWLDENIRYLRRCFIGCESFVTAYFPEQDDEDDYYTEKAVQEDRLKSLKELEDELASLRREDVPSRMGIWSTGTQRSQAIRGGDEYLTMRPSIRETPAFGPSASAAPHPSDYETARVYMRLKAWRSRVSAASVRRCPQKVS